MTKHALERLNERYGNKFTYKDINNIIKALKKKEYLEIIENTFNNTSKTVLLKYKNIPMKLIYAHQAKKIITALPLDIDEFNTFIDFIPEIDVEKTYDTQAL